MIRQTPSVLIIRKGYQFNENQTLNIERQGGTHKSSFVRDIKMSNT